MGFFGRLGKSLGTVNEINIEDYMNSDEMEGVDVLNEPADFYVKPFSLQQESDIQIIEAELQKKNIILLNINEMNKRPNTLKTMLDEIKNYVSKANGDIARIDEDKILITPTKVKIIKSKKNVSKS
ncbi:MAG: cell division protein SepF [Candidatus Micrarchaeaceae archaeon]